MPEEFLSNSPLLHVQSEVLMEAFIMAHMLLVKDEPNLDNLGAKRVVSFPGSLSGPSMWLLECSQERRDVETRG